LGSYIQRKTECVNGSAGEIAGYKNLFHICIAL
jgi:hypothetical protein